MDRRKFHEANGNTSSPELLLRPMRCPRDGAESSASTAAGRLILPMNRKWRYSRKLVEGGHAKDFDDSGFEQVVIPHTNIPLPWHSFDEKTYEFVSLYRRRFKLPAEARGKHVFVDFEGVMTAIHGLDQWRATRRIQRRLHAVLL